MRHALGAPWPLEHGRCRCATPGLIISHRGSAVRPRVALCGGCLSVWLSAVQSRSRTSSKPPTRPSSSGPMASDHPTTPQATTSDPCSRTRYSCTPNLLSLDLTAVTDSQTPKTPRGLECRMCRVALVRATHSADVCTALSLCHCCHVIVGDCRYPCGIFYLFIFCQVCVHRHRGRAHRAQDGSFFRLE